MIDGTVARVVDAEVPRLLTVPARMLDKTALGSEDPEESHRGHTQHVDRFVLTAVQPGRVPPQRSGGSNRAQNALTEVRRGEGNMMKRMRVQLVILLLAAIAASMSASQALAANRAEIKQNARNALKSLYAKNSAARLLGEKAKAVLVFPNIVKAGFLFGGQMGD